MIAPGKVARVETGAIAAGTATDRLLSMAGLSGAMGRRFRIPRTMGRGDSPGFGSRTLSFAEAGESG